MPNTVIIGINSDIGTHLAGRFIRDGHKVLGTWRSQPAPINCRQIKFDVLEQSIGEILDLIEGIQDEMEKCDNLIFCVGDPLPLCSFGDSCFREWHKSFLLNSTKQLEIFHFLWFSFSKNPSVCFLSAGGVNSCPKEFSAYTLGKTVLVKACELIAAETPNLNIFTYGPGWVPTKTHKLMADALPDGERKRQILEYMRDPPDIEQVMDEVYRDISILLKHPEASGKNFARGRAMQNLRGAKEYPTSGKLRITI